MGGVVRSTIRSKLAMDVTADTVVVGGVSCVVGLMDLSFQARVRLVLASIVRKHGGAGAAISMEDLASRVDLRAVMP